MTRNIYSVYYRTLTTVKGELIPQLVEQQFRQWSEAYTDYCGSKSINAAPIPVLWKIAIVDSYFFYEQRNLLWKKRNVFSKIVEYKNIRAEYNDIFASILCNLDLEIFFSDPTHKQMKIRVLKRRMPQDRELQAFNNTFLKEKTLRLMTLLRRFFAEKQKKSSSLLLLI